MMMQMTIIMITFSFYLRKGCEKNAVAHFSGAPNSMDQHRTFSFFVVVTRLGRNRYRSRSHPIHRSIVHATTCISVLYLCVHTVWHLTVVFPCKSFSWLERHDFPFITLCSINEQYSHSFGGWVMLMLILPLFIIKRMGIFMSVFHADTPFWIRFARMRCVQIAWSLALPRITLSGARRTAVCSVDAVDCGLYMCVVLNVIYCFLNIGISLLTCFASARQPLIIEMPWIYIGAESNCRLAPLYHVCFHPDSKCTNPEKGCVEGVGRQQGRDGVRALWHAAVTRDYPWYDHLIWLSGWNAPIVLYPLPMRTPRESKRIQTHYILFGYWKVTL